jgi:uncharacterized protein (DUF433 family)
MQNDQENPVLRDAELDIDEWIGDDELPIRWQEYISCNPQILVGKPAITGTRISVDLVLEFLAADWSVETILDAYPHLTRDQVLACVAYALQLVREKQRSSQNAAARR